MEKSANQERIEEEKFKFIGKLHEILMRLSKRGVRSSHLQNSIDDSNLMNQVAMLLRGEGRVVKIPKIPDKLSETLESVLFELEACAKAGEYENFLELSEKHNLQLPEELWRKMASGIYEHLGDLMVPEENEGVAHTRKLKFDPALKIGEIYGRLNREPPKTLLLGIADWIITNKYYFFDSNFGDSNFLDCAINAAYLAKSREKLLKIATVFPSSRKKCCKLAVSLPDEK